jgi:hypothetical protein
MKYPKIAFGLIVAVGLMAVATGPAMARGPRGVTCVHSTGGKWLNSLCTSVGSGEWETKEINETVEATASGTLEQEDSAATGGAVAIECSASGHGTFGAEGIGSVIAIKLQSCRFIKHGACEESGPVTSEFLNLPWTTRLEERENTETKIIELRNLLTAGHSGKPPGLAVECRVGGILKIVDECTGMFSNSSVIANRATGSIESEYDKVSAQEPGSCTLGNSHSGFLRGTIKGNLRNRSGEGQAAWPLAAILGT